MTDVEQGPRLAAVVLTGGSAVRLGGVDKASIEIGGLTLLERALAAVTAAAEVVVVGEQVQTPSPVTWTREDPRGGGPAAALLTGLDALLVEPDLVAVLACDMPRVTLSTIARLKTALVERPDADAALLVDEAGRRQPLAGVYRYDALVAARPDSREDEHGLAVRELVGRLQVVDVPAVGEEAADVDTWDDLRRLAP